ncbi:MAG: ABC transporter ATP-binding protein [Spirochaeta sp.]|jgi:NitT/TauT family transport system ATP-binding protein|nr:ABC transporter ATP-binding protein [Spirochaeta sp.]
MTGLAPVLQVDGVTYRYPGTEAPVVRDISFDLARGETLCVLGPSGSGKTTLLKLAASLLTPDSGTVRLGGTPVTRPGPERIVVFQDQDQLFPWKTVLDNVRFPLRRVGVSSAPAGMANYRSGTTHERARIALDEVELSDAAGLFPHQLSGGMRQRGALARAFVIEPPVLLLDEPFAAVDAPTRERLGALLQRLQTHHTPGVLFVTHDIEEALRLGDRLLVLARDGTVQLRAAASSAGPEELRRSIRSVLEG